MKKRKSVQRGLTTRPKGSHPPPVRRSNRPAQAALRTRTGNNLGSRGFSSRPTLDSAVMGPVTTTAPSSIGTTFPRSFFGFGGVAQALTDQDPEQSVRVLGRDLFDLPIKSGSGTAAAGFGGTAVYYANVAPLEISPRLSNLEEMFIFYAIRHLRVFYAPATASTSTAQIALGYTTEPDVIATSMATPTQAQIMEMEASVLSSAWQPFVMEMKHEGTRLYLCTTTSSEGFDIEYQGALACTLLNGVASTTYGQLWVEYVVDFYKPTPVLANPSWLLESQMWARDRSAYRPRPALRAADLLRDAHHRLPLHEEKKREAPMLEGKSIPPPAGTPSENGDGDGWVDPSPLAFRPAPSSAPGTPGYTPRVAVPAKRAQ
jgi:hypothetical protein